MHPENWALQVGRLQRRAFRQSPTSLPFQPRKLPACWPPGAITRPRRGSALALRRWPCWPTRPHPARDTQQRFNKQKISRNTGSILLISPTCLRVLRWCCFSGRGSCDENVSPRGRAPRCRRQSHGPLAATCRSASAAVRASQGRKRGSARSCGKTASLFWCFH